MQNHALQNHAPNSSTFDLDDATLLQFLYQAPIGLVQAASDGVVETINPMAVNLLTPLAPSGRLANLFEALGEVAPHLRHMVDAFPQARGTVCESLRIPLVGRADSTGSQILFVSVFKLDPGRLLAAVSDVVYERTRERAQQRSGLENELRQALADQRLFLQYQPLVSFKGAVGHPAGLDRGAGVEALVRWNHRIRGAVSPLEFIGVAEQGGLISALTEFVLSTACRQFVRWQTELGPLAPRRLAVNLSRGQLAQPEFVGMVRNILDTSEMPPVQLQLEVNEGLAARDEAVQNRLRDLKQLGLTLALDNFGAGHSSLTGLHKLPVDLIKIDRSFVGEAVDSAHHRILIDATVRVARSLRMSIAAEGIETEAQLAVVRQLGCESGQGYYFSEAMSAANIAHWLTGA